jgi:hypothetical protein
VPPVPRRLHGEPVIDPQGTSYGPTSYRPHQRRRFEPATTGATADLTGTVHLAVGGQLFCKAIHTDRPRARMHRIEARALRTLPAGVAPALVDELEVDSWLVLLAERLDGRHVGLAPDSPDLPAVAAALTGLSDALTPCPIHPVEPLAARWAVPLG